MPSTTIVCARCTLANLETDRFCAGCGLPLGGVQADAGVGVEAWGLMRPRASRSRRRTADP